MTHRKQHQKIMNGDITLAALCHLNLLLYEVISLLYLLFYYRDLNIDSRCTKKFV